jgi:hypothetical protein
MDSIVYHEIIPNNLLSEYKENQVVDFDISVPNRKINIGSFRLEAEVEVKYGDKFLNDTASVTGTAVNTKQILIDELVGAHAFFQQITCEVSPPDKGRQVVENLQEYPRYVKMAVAATSGKNDMNNSNHVCELRAALPAMTNMILQGVVPPNQPTDEIRMNPDFSIKPLFCMNSGEGAASYRQVGDVQISCTLNRNFGVLYGNDNGSNVKYALKDLKLRFTSSPDDGSDAAIVLKSKVNIKQSMQSSFSNMQTRVPSKAVTAMTASFQPQGEENSVSNNNYQLSKVPGLSKTQFLFSDSTNKLISYEIRNISEVQDKAIDSMVDTGRNSLSMQNLNNNNGFLVGLDFGGLYDLSSTKFSLQLTSGVLSNAPLICYMYFHTVLEL